MWDYGEDNRGPTLAAVSIGMAAFSVLAVALRSYTMSTILKRFVLEDYLAVIVCILQCGFSGVVVVGVSYGLGAHVEHVSHENRPKALIFKWAGQVAYIVVSTLVKFVVGIFLLRLCVNNTWQRITIIVLLCVVGLFNAFYVFMAIFQCQPIEYYWYRYTTNAPVTGKCNGRALATIPTYFAVLIGLVSDLILALLPATLIKDAMLDKKTKISVCCVLALGSLASVATIARVPYASQLLSNPDYLSNFTDLAIWSIVECGIAIIASSLATLRPLFIKMKLLANTHFTSRYGHSGGSTGLPMQSAKSTTIIISHGGSNASSSNKRNTAMTGSTAVSRGLSQSGGRADAAGGGIKVEKEFELSVMTSTTRDRDSPDSIDRLEAEVNEAITPGTTRRNNTYEQMNARRNSFGSRRPGAAPAPQAIFTAEPYPAACASPTPTTPSYSNHPSLHGAQRRPSDGPAVHATETPPPGHNYTRSEGGGIPAARALYSPPSFHLPTRLQQQHQSTVSTHSVLSRDSHATLFQGLSAPPRVPQIDYAVYAPPPPSAHSTPLGSPISMGRRGSPAHTTPGSPSAGARYPFPGQTAGQEIPMDQRRGLQRVSGSAFSARAEDEYREESIEEEEGRESAEWARPSPQQRSIPSPLRSNPTGAAARGNWL